MNYDLHSLSVATTPHFWGCARIVAVARVAAARKLLVWSWVLLRDEIDYPEFLKRASVRDLPARLHGLS
ncbi:hypothetical protein MYX82_11170 [Acidobacteria bacterium AH-259-D05]|nr:hypothetical protein [Acidobacteria bacterium AH-259-D05]